MDRHLIAIFCALLISSCAVPVKQIPLSSPMVHASSDAFVLADEAEVSFGTGYSRDLRAGTHWERVGTIERGSVYRPLDQVLTVEGFDIHEAYIVVADRRVVGFYLPVEKTFVQSSSKVVLNFENNQEK